MLRRLRETPDDNQRRLCKKLGIGLGGINVFQDLVDKGWVTMQNFSQNKRKMNYVYRSTPAGCAEKSAVTAPFLKPALEEYQALHAEIDQIKAEIPEISGVLS